MTAAARKLNRYLKRLGATPKYLLFPPICPVCGDVSGKRRIGEPCPECLSRLTDDMCTLFRHKHIAIFIERRLARLIETYRSTGTVHIATFIPCANKQ